jgi:hypothetical protein
MIQVPYGHGRISRMAPAMPPASYKTYAWSAPLRTHFRKGTCEEAGCEAYLYGWVSTFDLSTELGLKQYEFCKADKERGFSIQRTSLTIVKFVYKPGNRCFRSEEHRVPVGKPPRFLVVGGDWRGNPRGTPTQVHRSAEDWIDDFANHQDNLKTAIERG